jgi:hypothetical protein
MSRLRLACDTCGDDVTGARSAAIHVSHADVRGFQAEERQWTRHRQETRGDLAGLMTLDELLASPLVARWAVHCDPCNPHRDLETGDLCGDCYWFSPDRCETTWALLRWTAHLMEKTWVTAATDWPRFLQRLLTTNGQGGGL